MASEPPVQYPRTPEAELMRLREENELLKAENGRLRSYLNNIEKLTQRVLALRAHRARLLWLALGAGILLYAGIPGTPLNRALVDAWNALHPPRAHAHYVQPPIYDTVVPFPSPISSQTAVPSTAPLVLPSASAAPPTLVLKPLPSPVPSPSLPAHPCSVTHGQPPQCRPSPMI